RRHTRWPRDWSSDVCSSDLIGKMVEAPLHGNDVAFEIIGVVRATRYYDLHQTPPSMFFYNLQQAGPYMPTLHVRVGSANPEFVRSEERRVGKEWRSGLSRYE